QAELGLCQKQKMPSLTAWHFHQSDPVWIRTRDLLLRRRLATFLLGFTGCYLKSISPVNQSFNVLGFSPVLANGEKMFANCMQIFRR
ncbi:MAG TPA: hypothetical protein PK798_13720, partial [Flavobacteriales bacterium]|nr:hypothetical protein [Flavobacteriales bacterium]